MRSIKNIDFYRKYSSNDKVSTIFGALMSVLTLGLIFLFVGFEINKYLNPILHHKVDIMQSPISIENNFVLINFDIVFPFTPCTCRSLNDF